MRFNARREDDDNRHELPMTSFIDVVFLLLIFFMVTAAFVREAQLGAAIGGRSATAADPVDLRPQVVRVRQSPGGGVFEIGTRTVGSRDELTAVLMALPKDAGVFIRVDDDAPVGAAAAALQAAADAGYLKVSYVPAS